MRLSKAWANLFEFWSFRDETIALADRIVVGAMRRPDIWRVIHLQRQQRR